MSKLIEINDELANRLHDTYEDLLNYQIGEVDQPFEYHSEILAHLEMCILLGEVELYNEWEPQYRQELEEALEYVEPDLKDEIHNYLGELDSMEKRLFPKSFINENIDYDNLKITDYRDDEDDRIITVEIEPGETVDVRYPMFNDPMVNPDHNYGLYMSSDIDNIDDILTLDQALRIRDFADKNAKAFVLSNSEKNPYHEKNFKIQPLEGIGQGFAVRSDSERFGENAIVFQGTSYQECLEYISDKVAVQPEYYVIKDLVQCFQASFYEKQTGKTAEHIEIERFANLEDAIAKFNEYKGMDYLKETIPNINGESEPARRLALGVSAHLPAMGLHSEFDLLHTEGDKTLLISDALKQRTDGYEGFLTIESFVNNDLPKIIEEIKIDEFSGYRKQTVEDIANDILNGKYGEMPFKLTKENALKEANHQVYRHPGLLNKDIPLRIPMREFNAPFLKKSASTAEKIFVYSEYKRFDNKIDRNIVSGYEFLGDDNYSLSQRTDPKLALNFGSVENAESFIKSISNYDLKDTTFYCATEKEIEQMISDGKFKHEPIKIQIIDPSEKVNIKDMIKTNSAKTQPPKSSSPNRKTDIEL